jgi:hypothetical protein
MVTNSSSSFVIARSCICISSICLTYFSIIDAHSSFGSCAARQDDVSIYAHDTNWEPFAMSNLFDTMSKQLVSYGYEELGCIKIKRR